jgi:hypothetical protein
MSIGSVQSDFGQWGFSVMNTCFMYFVSTAMLTQLETKAQLVTTQEPNLQYLFKLGIKR